MCICRIPSTLTSLTTKNVIKKFQKKQIFQSGKHGVPSNKIPNEVKGDQETILLTRV